ncbi:uncharacterized protein LOC117524441 [Thalassophryne amazonica]|uniref:uncharacterized protein LOC117524441 n=1 Tax=Thalassophryne amazonica TaxID=390379 RepID=UPI0014711984|nr:uncharacterized protein LOC117524441 [Thalassophryne amazonica]
MFLGSPLSSNTPSPIPANNACVITESDSPVPPVLPQSLPCWATKACSNLVQAEEELRRLQKTLSTETQSVMRGVERAILGARREERRLIERVEQDHRDTQQQLEQIQRENMAAMRVSQSLLIQKYRKVAQLQQQIQEVVKQSGLDQIGPKQNLLLKEVAELLQPWEISFSLNKVNFKPSSQPNAVTFGDMCVQEQSLSLHVGGCGLQDQMCPLHSQEIQYGDTSCQGAGEQTDTEQQGWTSPTGRVVRKMSLSAENELQSQEGPKLTLPTMGCCLSKFEQSHWKSSQDDELESACIDLQGEDMFQGVSAAHTNKDTESKNQACQMNNNFKHYSPSNQRKPLPAVSGQKCFPSEVRKNNQEPVKLRHYFSLDLQRGGRGKVNHDYNGRHLKNSYNTLVAPRISHREPLTSKSCLDLTSGVRPHSCLSQSSDEHSLGTLGDSGRAPSPTDSLDSSYTFIIGSSHDYSMNRCPVNYSCHLSKSEVDLTRRPYPLIIEGTCIDNSNQQTNRGRGDPTLAELEDEDAASSLTVFSSRAVHLIRQFGKQGSGRADLTLPSGIYSTPPGHLFIVDCGNARVQVTDSRGNVLQQVTSPASDNSTRRCRNYFDIAVNAKGLIALSCAAERALLVFSRHGRLLQTFGGSGLASAKDEFEAPRGVTVTKQDEFLVADIRKGSLIALKLDPKTGSRVERTVVTGFHRPYLVATCLRSGTVAVSERGSETGRVPCIKVLEPGWNTVRVLGVCAGMGPVLSCPWGICIDKDENILVADWGEQHSILLYPAQGMGYPVITQGLSSPRGLTLLPDGYLAVSDSMHHCIKIYQYKSSQN